MIKFFKGKKKNQLEDFNHVIFEINMTVKASQTGKHKSLTKKTLRRAIKYDLKLKFNGDKLICKSLKENCNHQKINSKR